MFWVKIGGLEEEMHVFLEICRSDELPSAPHFAKCALTVPTREKVNS